MAASVTAAARDLLQGAVCAQAEKDGWVRPLRFTEEQLKALGSCRAWHPGLYHQMALCTAGVCLAFETDSSWVDLEVSFDRLPRGSASVIRDAQHYEGRERQLYDGVSAEVDGARLKVREPDETDVARFVLDNAQGAADLGMQRLFAVEAQAHTVKIWLPCLRGCTVRSVCGDGTYIRPVAPKGALLVLGDSISQGFISLDPGLAWPSLVAQRLKLELVNQGVGGQVFQPGSLVGLKDAVAPAKIVVELGVNYRFEPCQALRVQAEIQTFLYEVASAWPTVPTWVVTPMPHTQNVWPDHPRSCFDQVEDMIRACSSRHGNFRLVDGAQLLDSHDLLGLLIDGSDHPGTKGHAQIAKRLLAAMKEKA